VVVTEYEGVIEAGWRVGRRAMKKRARHTSRLLQFYE